MIAIVDPLSKIISIFIVPLFKRKTLLLISFFIVGLLNILLAIIEGANTDEGVFYVVVAIIVATAALQDPVQGIY